MLANRLRSTPLALVLACDLPPIEYETEYLRIGTDSEAPICAGTLHELDTRVRVVEDVLDFQAEGQLELYLFENHPEWCRDDAGGCYRSHQKRAYATIDTAGHELVHAVIHQNFGRADAFFNEGLAVDLTGQGLPFARTYPASNLGLSSPEVSQSSAGHFMRWLRSRYTASQIKDIVIYTGKERNPNHAENAFRKATGDEFAEIEQLYLATAPEFYAPFDIIAPPTVPAGDDGWDIVVSFDCTQTDTQGFGGEMWRRVRIEVTDPGPHVLVATSPTTATMTRHRTDDVQVGEPLPVPSWPIGDDWFDPPGYAVPGWPTSVQLEPGVYDIEIRVPGTSPTTTVVGLHPMLGSIPTVP